eukprot:s1727_g19.t1
MEVRFASSGAVAAQLALQEVEGKTAKEVKQRLADRLGTSRYRVRLLLDHEVVPDDKDGPRLARPPIAATRRACVKLLLNAHATVNKTCQGRSPLGAAADCGNATLVCLLLDARACPAHRSQDDGRPLLLASSRADVTAVAQLVASGASLTATDWRGFTPLHCAAHSNQADVARILLAARSCPDSCDDDGETPLTIASSGPSVEMVRLLLEARANVNLAEDESRAPLTAAAEKGRLAAARLLITARADVNHTWPPTYTPLWLPSWLTPALLPRLRWPRQGRMATMPSSTSCRESWQNGTVQIRQTEWMTTLSSDFIAVAAPRAAREQVDAGDIDTTCEDVFLLEDSVVSLALPQRVKMPVRRTDAATDKTMLQNPCASSFT